MFFKIFIERMPTGNDFDIRTQKRIHNEKIINFAERSMRLFIELVVGLSHYEAPGWMLAELIPLLICLRPELFRPSHRLFILPDSPLTNTCWRLRNIGGRNRARLIWRLASFLATSKLS